MSLRAHPIEEHAHLPEGRYVLVRIGVADDPYIPKKEMSTVDVELWNGRTLLGVVNSILSPEQDSEARAMARLIKQKLEAGEIEPTAGAIEPIADSLPG